MQPAALFSLMQDASIAHFHDMTGGMDLFEYGLCWVLVRLSVTMEAWPLWPGQLTVQTWQSGRRRLTFLRHYRFYDSTGHQLGQGLSEWLVVDRKKHRPARLPRDWADQVPETDEAGCPRLAPVRDLPSEPRLVKQADYSDIDRNEHVNNTRYVAWAVDALQAARQPQGSPQLLPLDLRAFDIHYRREAALGTRLALYTVPGADAQTFDIEAHDHDGQVPVFRARARLAKP